MFQFIALYSLYLENDIPENELNDVRKHIWDKIGATTKTRQIIKQGL